MTKVTTTLKKSYLQLSLHLQMSQYCHHGHVIKNLGTWQLACVYYSFSVPGSHDHHWWPNWICLMIVWLLCNSLNDCGRSHRIGRDLPKAPFSNGCSSLNQENWYVSDYSVAPRLKYPRFALELFYFSKSPLQSYCWI